MRYLPFFILINALICSTAIADPKSDIEAYSKAFEIGDYDKGTALLTEALASAKKELSPGSPLLAKIAYDYCLNQVIINAPEKAKDALAIFQKSMELNPKIAENSSIDEIMLIEAIVKSSVPTGDKSSYKEVDALKKAIEKYNAKYPDDTLLLNAYHALVFAYHGLAEWSKLAKASDELLLKTEYFKDLSPTDRRNYEIIGYFFRGQGRFAASILTMGDPKIRSFELLKSKPFWVQADADLHKTVQLYGKPQSKLDKTYQTIMVWSNLVGAYYASFHRKYKNNNEAQSLIEDNDHKLIFEAIGENSKNPQHIQELNICEAKIQINIDHKAYASVPEKYNFGASAIAVDLTDKGEQTNVRVLASVPTDELAAAVIKSTEKRFAKIADDTPKECLKDFTMYVTFITETYVAVTID